MQKHIVKHKEYQFCRICYEKSINRTFELISIVIIAVIITITAIFSFKNGFGQKPCLAINTYTDTSTNTCVSCAENFINTTCINCDGPDTCAVCATGSYLVPNRTACTSCNSSDLGYGCLECTND